MKSPVFTGSCTALVTPFTADGIDYEGMGELIDFQIKSGTDALLVCGTTGESAAMTDGERSALVKYCVSKTDRRVPVIVGIGSNNTLSALDNAVQAEEAGADAVLMVTPYYNKTTQTGLVEHFSYVADRVDVPVILYNVPSRTGIGITAETYSVLAQHPNINGVKEASGDFSLFSRTRYLCGDALNIWSGNDDCAVGMMALGAKGVISVASNLIPNVISELCSLALDGDFSSAAELHLDWAELFDLLFCEVNPIPIKAAMELAGLCSGRLRLPLTAMSSPNAARLERFLSVRGLTAADRSA